MKSIVIFGLILASGACHKEKKNDIPSCVQLHIENLKRIVFDPPAEVNEYLYNGEKVYWFTNNCCDQFFSVIDDSCRYICAPLGTLGGPGDGRCPDFHEKAQHLRLLWKSDP